MATRWHWRPVPVTPASSGVSPTRGASAQRRARPVSLLNPGSGMCLDDPGSSTHNGTRVVVWSCNGFRTRRGRCPPGRCHHRSRACAWMTAATAPPTAPRSTYGRATAPRPAVDHRARRHRAGARQVPGVQRGGTASGTPVDLWSCNGTGAQQWQLIPGGGGASLVNPQSGLCLADPGNPPPRAPPCRSSPAPAPPGRLAGPVAPGRGGARTRTLRPCALPGSAG